MNNRVLLVVWDDIGVETVQDLTEFYDSNNLLTVIANPKSGHRNPYFNWQLRARFNTHRNYEIYMIAVDSEITTEDFIKYFDEDPAMMKDLVKSKGHNIGY